MHIGAVDMKGQHGDVFAQEIVDELNWDRTRDSDWRRYSPLLDRGWAFQECCFARRIISFTAREVYFECLKSAYCHCRGLNCMTERKTAFPEPTYFDKMFHRRRLSSSSKNPQVQRSLMQFWTTIVESHAELELTRKTDRLPALSGFAARFARADLGIYLAGMWRKHLPHSLFWQRWPFKPAHRPPQYVAPSWSWASIVGAVRYNLLGMAQFDLDTILEASCDVPGKNPYGEVEDGRLIVKVKVLRSSYPWSKDSVGAEERFAKWVAFDTDEDRSNAMDREITLAGFRSNNAVETVNGWEVLLLRPSTNGTATYTRIGVCSMFPSDCLDKYFSGAATEVLVIV